MFVDEVNIYRGCMDHLGYAPNHLRLKLLAEDGNHLVRAFIYVTHPPGDTASGWLGTLRRYGFDVRAKEIRQVAGKGKANWDIGLCVDVIRMLDSIDVVVIASGDGDFEELIRYCQSRGKIVRVIAVRGSTAHVMRELPDEFIEIIAMDLQRDGRDHAEILSEVAHADPGPEPELASEPEPEPEPESEPECCAPLEELPPGDYL